MPIFILGQDLLFWIAAVLTLVIFIDFATCWCFGIRKLARYHKYTRVLLIVLAIAHMVFHILFQVYGIVF